MKAVLIGVGALLVALVLALVVWLSVAADAAALWRGAGIYALVVLAFPAFIGFAVWRGWGDDEIRYRGH